MQMSLLLCITIKPIMLSVIFLSVLAPGMFESCPKVRLSQDRMPIETLTQPQNLGRGERPLSPAIALLGEGERPFSPSPSFAAGWVALLAWLNLTIGQGSPSLDRRRGKRQCCYPEFGIFIFGILPPIPIRDFYIGEYFVQDFYVVPLICT